MQALIVKAETMETSIVDIPREGALPMLQEAVGGWIEAVSLRDFDFYCNEEGKLTGLPVNEVATALWEEVYGPTDVIMGDIIIVGPVDGEGYNTELSTDHILTVQAIAKVLRGLHGMDTD